MGPFVFDNDRMTLEQVLGTFQGDAPKNVPWQIRLLENPLSPLALPGSVDLLNHDCIHVLLNQDLSLEGEAVVLGCFFRLDALLARRSKRKESLRLVTIEEKHISISL